MKNKITIIKRIIILSFSILLLLLLIDIFLYWYSEHIIHHRYDDDFKYSSRRKFNWFVDDILFHGGWVFTVIGIFISFYLRRTQYLLLILSIVIILLYYLHNYNFMVPLAA